MTDKKLATYKQWTNLHENFAGAIPLGVKSHHTIGLVSDAHIDSLDESLDGLDLEALTRLEEACKKAKKKMLADLEKPEVEIKPELEIKPEKEEPEDEEDDDDEHEEDESPEEEEEEHDDDDKGEKKLPAFLKKKPEAKPEIMMSKKKAKKHMTAEDANWWHSLKGQTSLKNDDEGNWDGFTPLPSDEPAPGEPGFAPQTRIGWFQ